VKESFGHLLLRAVVTFAEVALSTAVGANVFSWGVTGWQTAAVAGIGAALSVIYNWLVVYEKKLDKEAGG
jgi:hypothetical protein